MYVNDNESNKMSPEIEEILNQFRHSKNGKIFVHLCVKWLFASDGNF